MTLKLCLFVCARVCVCCVLISGVSVASEAGESAVVWSAGEFQSPL